MGEINSSADDEIICSAITAMARNLGLNVVAEGVETQAQLQTLRRLGCNEIQGFLLGKPMPAELFMQVVSAQHSALPGDDTAARMRVVGLPRR